MYGDIHLLLLFSEDEPVVFHLYVVGISVGIVTLVLGVLAFIPYWMWRKRLVFILKIVHYFQQYEEDGKKKNTDCFLGHFSLGHFSLLAWLGSYIFKLNL